MAQVISGLRVARSFVSPTGATNVVSREIDFQLGARQGIQIHSVLGYGFFADNSPAVSDTIPITDQASQSLHLETGTLETLPLIAGEDEDDTDTEIFWAQAYGVMFQVPSTAGAGGGSLIVTPSSIVDFKNPIQTARNITHSGRTVIAGVEFQGGVLIYYNYVLFNNSELGFLLARRQ